MILEGDVVFDQFVTYDWNGIQIKTVNWDAVAAMERIGRFGDIGTPLLSYGKKGDVNVLHAKVAKSARHRARR